MDKDHINEDAKYKLWLGRIRNIRANKIKLMVDYFGSPEEAYNAPHSALEQMIIVSNSMEAGFTRRDLDSIMMGRDMDIVSR